MINRTIIIVLDSLGIGELPDADKYGDIGANTLGHIYEMAKPKLSNMKKLGLYNIDGLEIPDKEENIIGNFGKAKEKSEGKNSPVGHWEIAGFVNESPFKTYPNGFPKEMIEEFKKKTGLKGTLYNGVGSGTDLLEKYGEEHIKTGFPIIYTSADSVFQIAAHEDIISVERLYEICQIAREMLNKEEYNIGTVIARPFIGDKSDNFTRTYNRKDFESSKFGKTMLDVLCENEDEVVAIGKIQDLFTGRGIKKAIHTEGNADGIEKTIQEIKNNKSAKLIFTNLVDFDMLYGHRNNVEGYAKALEYFDSKLPEIMQEMNDDDLLIITADHGNDPTYAGTDHTREYIPFLAYSPSFKGNGLIPVGHFSDISATVAENFGVDKAMIGESFLDKLI